MKPSVLTVCAGIAMAICATVLTGLHDVVPQWMPLLAVFLVGHGVGATVPSSVIAALAPGSPSSTSTTTTSSTTGAVPPPVPPAPIAAASSPAPPAQPSAGPQPAAVP